MRRRQTHKTSSTTAHVTHLQLSLPSSGEILRAVRCTSNYLSYTTILDRLLEKFKSRGYPEWLLRQTAEQINHKDRSKLLQPSPKRTLEDNTTVFCSTFTPGINSSTIRRMLVDPETPFNPMVLRTRPTSIQDRLVRANRVL